MESIDIAKRIIDFLDSKKAIDIMRIEIKDISILGDYFIICSGNSTTHIKGLADELIKELKKNSIECLKKEGYESARWILVDYGDVIVHIFHKEDRKFYNLERIWADGKIKSI
ncbi:MAG: ribosome silencing factor [Clostridiales bacterium]